jgi:hypothetical protein
MLLQFAVNPSSMGFDAFAAFRIVLRFVVVYPEMTGTVGL